MITTKMKFDWIRCKWFIYVFDIWYL